MVRRGSLTIVFFLVLLVITAASAQAGVGWHTRTTAERNILHAPRALARWNPALVDQRTHLVRTHVAVACTGRGRQRKGRFERFACVVRFGKIRISMIYVAQSRNGFELHGRTHTAG